MQVTPHISVTLTLKVLLVAGGCTTETNAKLKNDTNSSFSLFPLISYFTQITFFYR